MSRACNRFVRLRLCHLEARTAPAAGMLDPTFGVGGRVTTRDPIPVAGIGTSTAIDSLGRIVVAGYGNLNGSIHDFAVARYTPAGALDTSFGFGGTGVVTFGIGASDDLAESVAIDSLDRVVVAGYSYNGSNNDFAVARLTAAGALDTTFDDDGRLTIAIGGSTDIAYGVAVDSLDRVVVAGFTDDTINYHFAVARLTVAGGLDSSFDGDGKQTIEFGPTGSGAHSVDVDSLDRVMVAGYSYNGSSYDFAVARLTAAGALDNSFDGDGKQTISFGPSNDGAEGVAIDSLGRVVVAGGTTNGSTDDIAVARLTATGALDSSFDGDGKQTVAFGASSEYAFGVDVDSLGRVVAVGYTDNGGTYDFAVTRLTVAGVLDSTFDGDGKQTIAFGPDYDLASGVAVDALDRVVVAGHTYDGEYGDFAVARLTAAGALDGGFDGDGRQTLRLTVSFAAGASVAVDNLGRTVVAGQTSNGSNADFMVIRYTTAGALDVSFGGTGVVKFGFGQANDYATGVAVDSLDRVVVAGYTNGNFAVARLTAAGALDVSFDSDGKRTIDFGANYDSANAVAVDSLDRIVVAGFTYDGLYDFAVARLTAAGALDPSFDSDGRQTIDFGTVDDRASAVAVDSLDRIVVAGVTDDGGFGYVDFAVARLTAAGALDSSFDGDGRQTIEFGSDNESASSVAIDSLDRVLIAGYTFTGTDYVFAVARLTTAGALDGTFDGDGRRTIAFGAGFDFAYAVAVDSLDRVVVAGSTNDGGNTDFAVARLTAAGALDGTFDSDGKQTVDFGTHADYAVAVAIASADRVVLAGQSGFSGSQEFAVARLTGDTTIASAQVNDGSAQRSRVTSLTIRFSGVVTFSGSAAAAFTLIRNGGKPVSFIANVSVEFGGTVVTLTNFTGPESDNFGSLRDGRYTLTALASQISAGGQALDGDANGTPGGNFVLGDTQGLFRMFGDFNGDRQVDGFDFSAFSSTFNLTSANPNFLAMFDINGDGIVDGFDFSHFSGRFNTILP